MLISTPLPFGTAINAKVYSLAISQLTLNPTSQLPELYQSVIKQTRS